jgi:hypothetical protein
MRKAALIPVVVVATGLMALPASSALADSHSTTLHLVGTNTSNVNQPHGFSFTEVLRNQNGKKVGNDLGSCVLNRAKMAAACQVGLALDGGVLVGTFVARNNQTVFHGKIVTGSGAYEGATGWFTAVSHGNRTAITLTYHK